ncbi:GTP 3',8-cyclase MoaA [Bdellovibrionota bacterium FG-1]
MERRNLETLGDSFGRKFQYLRLSITDQCNFRCVYCLPDGYQRPSLAQAPLSPVEIHHLISAFAELGIWKVRLTGGEPTVRRDLFEVVAAVKGVSGIRRVALSTNGHNLRRIAPDLKKAGVSALNVSIDSLDPEQFKIITGRAPLDEILDGVETALDLGFESIKVNVVILKDLNETEIDRFLDWVQKRPIAVRFIELMRTGRNSELFEKHHLSGAEIQHRLRKTGWTQCERQAGDGPAVEYAHPEYRGKMGIIAPYSTDFCQSCNRLRVSSQGALRLCLFGEQDYSLRPLLQSASQKQELKTAIVTRMFEKPVSHFLKEGKYGNTWNLSGIGG